jgi:peptidoglycan/LPS O-acetylase OafA/YrhL
MSTSAETSTPARKGRGRLPVYKRRRRRIYGAAALVLAVIVGVVVWATTGGLPTPLMAWTAPLFISAIAGAAGERWRCHGPACGSGPAS